jgi:serine phosphatase RsbU (regulator of sigma subunit)
MARVTDSAASAAGANTARSRILVVDDDVAIGGTIKRYLRQYDIEVVDCIDDALVQLDRQTYDLVLLDRRLPDGLGDIVVEWVRSQRWSLPIIMMSGEIDLQQYNHRPQNQPDDFIEKPFVREALVEKIERLLTAHALRQQAAQQRHELADMHARHDREVDVARTIFDRMFARGEFDSATVRHLVIAADRLAGDVVFGTRLGDGIYRWMIGDVTGHTLSSALVTIPLAVIFYATARDRRSFAQVLEIMERELAAMLPANMFCVAALCELDRHSRTLQVWNGGNPDVLIRRGNGDVVQIPSCGLPLAADRYGAPSHEIIEHRVAPGDRIYAFSDGLIELRDAAQQMIGFDRLLEISRTGSAETIFDRFLGCIPDHTGAIGYDDDVSLIEVIV